MNENLSLGQLYAGNTDAKDDFILTGTKDEFFNSFIIQDENQLQKFHIGIKFFIYGMKGTGKTAQLRYLENMARNGGILTHIILFKSKIRDEQREELVRIGNISLAEIGDRKDEQDYENGWMWYIFKTIRGLLANQNKIFKEDEAYCEFCILVDSLLKKDKWFSSFLPKIKNGNVKLQGKLTESLCTSLDIEFIQDDDSSIERQATFTRVCNLLEQLFSNLTPTGKSFYIYFDELEISFTTQKKYSRDSRLVRDLIAAIFRFNVLSIERNIKVRIFAAIRSEVLLSISAFGKEINKIVFDTGYSLSWNVGKSDISHPLMCMLIRRLQVSENKNDLNPNESGNVIFNRYFPDKINTIAPEKYILDNSWKRPRDIVRILFLAKDKFPTHKIFSQAVFEGIKYEYATTSWIEIAEELKTHFSDHDLEAIRKLLSFDTYEFSISDLIRRCEERQQYYSELVGFFERHKPGNIIETLYRNGVLGNIQYRDIPGKTYVDEEGKTKQCRQKEYRFADRGNDLLNFEGKFILHPALRPIFR
jgi:hypothetical protein